MKMVCPFGVVIAGTNLFAESNLFFTGKVIANLLDPTSSGKIIDGSELDKLRDAMSAEGGLMIGGGVSEKDE